MTNILLTITAIGKNSCLPGNRSAVDFTVTSNSTWICSVTLVADQSRWAIERGPEIYGDIDHWCSDSGPLAELFRDEAISDFAEEIGEEEAGERLEEDIFTDAIACAKVEIIDMAKKALGVWDGEEWTGRVVPSTRG